MLSLSGPCTRAGVLLSALIVVMTIIGITMHRDFYADCRRKDFFCFYTNVSNLVVLLYFALIAPRLYAKEILHAAIPHAEFAVMMCIMLTCCIFHLVLYPAVRRAVQGMPRSAAYHILCTDNLIIHYLVPLAVFFYWLFCSPQKQSLGRADSLYWTALPLGYVFFVFLRAHIKGIIEETGSPYPYPFLDMDTLGIKRTLLICVSLYILCLLSGLLIIALVHAFRL